MDIMDYTNNIVALHLRIDILMKTILKDGNKISLENIPELVLLISELMPSSKKNKMIKKELNDTINDMYNYIMTQYKLYPDNEEDRVLFKTTFDNCIKLLFFKPNIIKVKNRLLSCFKRS
jgi:hypothetical protein